MIQIETEEEAGVWLVTYRAGLRARAKVPSAIDVADAAVEAWRERVGPPHKPEEVEASQKSQSEASARAVAERDAYRRELGAARKHLEEVRRALKTNSVPDDGLPMVVAGIMAANEALREKVEAVTLEVAESPRAACHQDLAAVRVALGAHNRPDRSIADCVRALVDGYQEVTGQYVARDEALAAVRKALGPWEVTSPYAASCVAAMRLEAEQAEELRRTEKVLRERLADVLRAPGPELEKA